MEQPSQSFVGSRRYNKYVAKLYTGGLGNKGLRADRKSMHKENMNNCTDVEFSAKLYANLLNTVKVKSHKVTVQISDNNCTKQKMLLVYVSYSRWYILAESGYARCLNCTQEAVQPLTEKSAVQSYCGIRCYGSWN